MRFAKLMTSAIVLAYSNAIKVGEEGDGFEDAFVDGY